MAATSFPGLRIPVFLGVLAFSLPPAAAQTPLTTTRVASGLTKPVFATAPPADPGRLFVLEQGSNTTAHIKIVDLVANAVLPQPFLTLSGVSHEGERGLLGLAFHPGYATNGFFYVYVSDTVSSQTVRRYRVSGNPNVADAASGQNVMVFPDPWSNHNGGWIGFGPDGYLYISTGDSGFNPQDPSNRFGKILRIDVDGDDFPADPNENWRIPPTNPFRTTQGGESVWNYGLRNPWRVSIDRGTGDLYIGDVGWNSFEEIDYSAAGQGARNYGWECMEGFGCTGLDWACTCNGATLTMPIVDYPHSLGCSVTGGYVYRGSALCGLEGTYFYGDYCSGRIWSLRYGAGGVSEQRERTGELDPPGALAIQLISAFGEDANGEIYICDHMDGEIYKIVAAVLQSDCNQNGIEDACDISGGASRDANGDGVPDECQPGATAFCFGDGTSSPCPCANTGAAGRGCQNSALTGGALLSSAGNASVAQDTLVFTSVGQLSSELSICVQGDLEIAARRFGDGLRCTGGNTKRLYVKSAIGGTVVVPGPAELRISARSAALGSPISPGQLRIYQVYYRDPSSTFCPTPPGNTFNASGGLRILWGS